MYPMMYQQLASIEPMVIEMESEINPVLTSMPARTPAGVLDYKVRTWVCLHHEKKISRRSPEIITWESRRSPE